MQHFDPVGHTAMTFSDHNGGAVSTAPESPSAVLSALEDFLLQLASIASVDRLNPHTQDWLNIHYRRMPAYLATAAMLPTEYSYSDHLNVFIDSCQQAGLLQIEWYWHPQSTTPIRRYRAETTRMSWQLFDELLWLLRERCRFPSFRKQLAARKRDGKARYQDYCHYINALFAQNDRLIAIRIDLGYSETESAMTGCGQASTDIDHLLENRRWNALFDHMVGYIIKTEFGLEKGMHFHALLFFNGSERNGNSHVHLAQQIGEYWKSVITKGRGIYWNSNAQIADFEQLGRCGIGLIHWNDQKTRENLLNLVLDYLCKNDQYFRPEGGNSLKLMRRGLVPIPRAVKLGRPRNDS